MKWILFLFFLSIENDSIGPDILLSFRHNSLSPHNESKGLISKVIETLIKEPKKNAILKYF